MAAMLDFATNCTDTSDMYRFLKRQSYLEISKQGQLRIWIALTNRFAKQAHFFMQARQDIPWTHPGPASAAQISKQSHSHIELDEFD